MAPGNSENLRAVAIASKRPDDVKEPISQEISDVALPSPLALRLRRASQEPQTCAQRRGSKTLSEDHRPPSSARFSTWHGPVQSDVLRFRSCLYLCNAILDALGIGHMTALTEPGGRVRGIVPGDIVGKLMARTPAQQLTVSTEEAIFPFRFALPARAGGKRVVHLIQTLTDLDDRATLLSVDGIGCRGAMLEGWRMVDNGASVRVAVLRPTPGDDDQVNIVVLARPT